MDSIRFNLCCGNRKCPEVLIGDSVIIKDDFGGSINITKPQLLELVDHKSIETLRDEQ